MPLKLKTYKDRPHYYLRGTVKANRKRAHVYESTGIRIGSVGAKAKAEELRLRREAEILDTLITGKPNNTLSWLEIAERYCRDRQRRRLLKRPDLKDTIDPEAGYVLRFTDFLRSKKLADRPLRELTEEVVQAYFDKQLQGSQLSYLRRCRNNYVAVMRFAIAQEACDARFPRPILPAHDPKKVNVEKNLPLEVINLFRRLAPPHARLFFACLFELGLRGGELLFAKRTPPDASRPWESGLSVKPGREFLHLGVTKDGRPFTRAIPKYLAHEIREAIKARTDRYDCLFLTDKGVPYRRAKVQRGTQFRTVWNSTREKVVAELERQLVTADERRQSRKAAELREWIALAQRATGHWGRHSMISRAVIAGKTDRQIMDLSGHRSPQMIARYTHLGNDEARVLAETLAIPGSRSRNPKANATAKASTGKVARER